ncbi:hypothetical protein BLNAU_22570 [Blattamonas nauphoetae]|uniref:Uncharacterized protein n=1 Tax=Blattamonas nauphoetae TaxID=2049346 RepID=A0ABQ9WSN8_9EUKA|nr:hypothetical protein BLNAU_22570 [Blattamonas nauphoetae]
MLLDGNVLWGLTISKGASQLLDSQDIEICGHNSRQRVSVFEGGIADVVLVVFSVVLLVNQGRFGWMSVLVDRKWKISQNTVSFSGCSCDDANAGSVIHITRPFLWRIKLCSKSSSRVPLLLLMSRRVGHRSSLPSQQYHFSFTATFGVKTRLTRRSRAAWRITYPSQAEQCMYQTDVRTMCCVECGRAVHCSVGGSGGVLFVSCASSIISTQLVVKVTSFDMCSSDSGKGGCVFVSDITRTDRKPVLGRRCYTLVNTIQLSHAAYVSCQFLSSCRLSRIRWTRCVGCGRSDLPCGTLEHSLTHLSTHSTNIVTIASSASLDFELETTRSSLELSGKGEIKQNAKVEDGGLITASGNSFTLNNLHLSTELASALR